MGPKTAPEAAPERTPDARLLPREARGWPKALSAATLIALEAESPSSWRIPELDSFLDKSPPNILEKSPPELSPPGAPAFPLASKSLRISLALFFMDCMVTLEADFASFRAADSRSYSLVAFSSLMPSASSPVFLNCRAASCMADFAEMTWRFKLAIFF